MTSSDAVFYLRGDQITKMPSRQFRDGLGGEALEAALQKLLANHPYVLPGEAIAPSASSPPRFALLGTEITLDGRYSVDHVMTDQRGVPTLIETKLFQNPESRRDVIGQILEYAALGLAEWGDGALRHQASEYWRRHGSRVESELDTRFGSDLDQDGLWDSVEENIQNGVLRLIIAGDRIRPDVRRVIEMLNTEMQHIDVLGLELACFGDTGDEVILVPRVVGQTQRAVDLKKGNQRRWFAADLRDHYEQLAADEPIRAKRLHDILEWASNHDLFIESVSVNPCFAIGGSNGKRLLTVNPEGVFHWYVSEKQYEDWGGRDARARFYDGLRDIGLAGEGQDPEQATSSRDLRKRIEELSSEEYDAFKKLMAATITM